MCKPYRQTNNFQLCYNSAPFPLTHMSLSLIPQAASCCSSEEVEHFLSYRFPLAWPPDPCTLISKYRKILFAYAMRFIWAQAISLASAVMAVFILASADPLMWLELAFDSILKVSSLRSCACWESELSERTWSKCWKKACFSAIVKISCKTSLFKCCRWMDSSSPTTRPHSVAVASWQVIVLISGNK